MTTFTIINDNSRNSNIAVFQKPGGGGADSIAWKTIQNGTSPSYDFNIDLDISTTFDPSTTAPATSTPPSWETDYTYDAGGAPSVTVDPTASFALYL